MARSTGLVLTAGGITIANQILLEEPAGDWFKDVVRVGVGTGLVAFMLSGVEKGSPDLAVAIGWAAILMMMVVPIQGKPTPSERILAWWNER